MGRPRKIQTASPSPKKVALLPGFEDALASSDALWNFITRRFAKVAKTYGFERTETPLVEQKALYENYYRNRPSALSQIISLPGGALDAALRPSILPSLLRAYSQHKIHDQQQVSKWYYAGMVSRKEPESGEMEGDYEFGLEILGNFSHLTEAQVLAAVWDMLSSLGLQNLTLEISTIGSPECQKSYEDVLQDFLRSKKYQLCDNCSESISRRPLDVFRCQSLDCQSQVAEAPTVLDFLDQPSHQHFTSVLEALDELGLPYQLNSQYVGPAGFSRTNAAIKIKTKSGTVTLGEAGYHDQLSENVCGKPHRSFGFSGSFSLIRRLLSETKVEVEKENKSDVFLVPLGELASKKSLRLFRDLVGERISVYDHFGQSGVKNQLRQAQESHAPIALIMGQKEAMDEMVILRDVKSGMQEVISYDKIVQEVKKRLGR